MDDLRRRVGSEFLSQPYPAQPQDGPEIGGLLLGQIRAGHPPESTVEAFEEIRCEHKYGPGYELSTSDRQRLAEVLFQRRTQQDIRIVGFFRTCTGETHSLSRADRELFRLYFPDEHYALLLLKAVSADDCEATVAFNRGGHLPAKLPYPWFRFSAAGIAESSAAAREASHTEEAGVRRDAPAIAGRQRVELASHAAPAAGDMARRWRLPLAVCVLGAVGAAGVYQWSKRSDTQTVDLKLDARQLAGELELHWDRDSPAVAGATRGILTVSDDDSTRKLPLGQEELRRGAMLYRTTRPDVLFHLQLFGSHIRPSGDSIRVLTVAPAAAARQGEAARSAPAAIPPNGAEGAPAVAIHEVQPQISEGIRGRIQKPVAIAVDVRISESGAVRQAVARGKRQGVQRYLAGQAVRAARSWRFTPARSDDGTPVASKKTIQFVFKPAGG